MALHRIVGLAVCISISSVAPGVAADRVSNDRGRVFNEGGESPDHQGFNAVENVRSAVAEPRISGDLPEGTETTLREAFPVALQRIRNIPECRELFTALSADAIDKMTTSSYRATDARMETRVCQRGVSAFTSVSTSQVRLCRRFAKLGTEKAAAALIHEALHWAGLGEWPHDKDGLRASEIDRMVRKACDF
jgi:hypothetical protein